MSELLMLSGSAAVQDLADVLRSRGLRVYALPSLEAIERCCFESQPPAVIFLDYESPEMDPIDVCRRWKLTRPLYFPSLVFVADTLDTSRVVDGLRTGANLVLTRPFEPGKLATQVLDEMHRFDGVRLPIDSSYVIGTKVEYLSATNRFLDLVLHTTEARSDAVEDLRLCMGELGMNAIVHGNQGVQGRKVHVHYRIGAKRIEVSIADEGPGFRPQDLPDPTSPERLLLPTGRGIFLVRQFTDELSFNELGNEVRFVKHIG
jgi:serine/threonine-protein kinase RsbW